MDMSRKIRQRVVYLSDVDLSLGRGPSVNELEFVDALVLDESVDAAVVVPRPSGTIRQTVLGRLTEILPFPIRRRNLIHLLLFETALVIYLLRLRVRFSSTTIVLRVSFLPLGMYLIAPVLRGRFHLKTVGDGSFRYLRRAPLGALLVKLHRHMYRRIVRFARSVDMVTETHREEFSRHVGFSEKCFVVDNRVNTDFFFPRDRGEVRQRLGLQDYRYVFGYVGNDPLNRGASEAIGALRKLRGERGVNAAVLIVGAVDPQQAAELLSTPEDVHIRLVGQVPYMEVPILMNALDVGVSFLPAWHRGASEQKVRQYLACGVVPVVTPGGSAFVAEQGVGFVSDNVDIETVASTIHHALQKSSVMSRECRAYAVEHLSHRRLWADRKEIIL